ncbi:THOC2 protein, partial [Acromyrmex insinuator]
MLETVMRWHSEKAIFDKECSNYPGFVTKFHVSNQFSEANDMVGFENYRHVCHKWHYKITKPHRDALANYANNTSSPRKYKPTTSDEAVALADALELSRRQGPFREATRVLESRETLMYGNATCTHYYTSDKATPPGRENRRLYKGDLSHRDSLAGARPSRPWKVLDSLTSCVLSRALAKLATAQVPGSNPPGRTQGSLSPLGGLIAPDWRVAPRLR